MIRRIYCCLLLAILGLLFFSRSVSAAKPAGPWHVQALKQPPEATWSDPEPEATEAVALVQKVFYTSEPFEGQPTRVFAYYARPKEGEGPFPGMVLVHGGGGKAFAEWVTRWAERGYAALAMDLSGRGPDGERLEDGGPDQDDKTKFREFADGEVNQMWTYHAVASVIRGHSLLASRQEVDAARIGITGISWGGYLTCIVAGLDDRLKVAVPVYGCGFLDQDSVWLPTFERMAAEQRQRWVRNFDPSRYLSRANCPMLFVNGTNDFAYPLDSYQRSYQLVPGGVDLCVRVKMPHSHPDGWAPKEIGIFVDSVLRQGRPLAQIEPLEVVREGVRATFTSSVPVTEGNVHYAVGEGPWKDRTWVSRPAVLAGGTVSAELPTFRPLVCYLSITDQRGAMVSTPHVVFEKPAGRLAAEQ